MQFKNCIKLFNSKISYRSPKLSNIFFKKAKPLPQSTLKALLFSDFQNLIHKC